MKKGLPIALLFLTIGCQGTKRVALRDVTGMTDDDAKKEMTRLFGEFKSLWDEVQKNHSPAPEEGEFPDPDLEKQKGIVLSMADQMEKGQFKELFQEHCHEHLKQQIGRVVLEDLSPTKLLSCLPQDEAIFLARLKPILVEMAGAGERRFGKALPIYLLRFGPEWLTSEIAETFAHGLEEGRSKEFHFVVKYVADSIRSKDLEGKGVTIKQEHDRRYGGFTTRFIVDRKKIQRGRGWHLEFGRTSEGWLLIDFD